MPWQKTVVSTCWSNKCSSYGVRPPWNPQQQQDLANTCESMHGVARQVPVAQVVIGKECCVHESFSTHSVSYLVVMFTSPFMNQITFLPMAQVRLEWYLVPFTALSLRVALCSAT
jgi:hypothetical protein